jgi:hypothetical protein
MGATGPYNRSMDSNRLQFRVAHLLAAAAYISIVLATAQYLRGGYHIDSFFPIVYGLPLFISWSIAGVCLCFRHLRWPALMILMVICGVFIRWQSANLDRWNRLEAEVPLVVAYLEEFKSDRGDYPQDLSGYPFRYPDLREYVTYFVGDANDYAMSNPPQYRIRYHPIHVDGIAHWYWHGKDNGYWYEDD